MALRYCRVGSGARSSMIAGAEGGGAVPNPYMGRGRESLHCIGTVCVWGGGVGRGGGSGPPPTRIWTATAAQPVRGSNLRPFGSQSCALTSHVAAAPGARQGCIESLQPTICLYVHHQYNNVVVVVRAVRCGLEAAAAGAQRAGRGRGAGRPVQPGGRLQPADRRRAAGRPVHLQLHTGHRAALRDHTPARGAL